MSVPVWDVPEPDAEYVAKVRAAIDEADHFARVESGLSKARGRPRGPVLSSAPLPVPGRTTHLHPCRGCDGPLDDYTPGCRTCSGRHAMRRTLARRQAA